MAIPRPAPGTGRWWVLGLLVGGSAVVLISWVTLVRTNARVTATTIGYRVVDDTRVTVSFDVSKPPELPVVCTLRALDSSFGVVGSVDVDVPPSSERVTSRTGTIRTTTRAVTGLVQDCVRR